MTPISLYARNLRRASRRGRFLAITAASAGLLGAPLAMAQTASPQASAQPSGSSAPQSPAIQAGPISLLFGGFTELAAIYRNRQEAADVGSNFNTAIPYPQSPLHSIPEFRMSARQSRLSLLAQGQPYNGAKAEAYFEMDFLGAAPTANSNESNSYNLRMRNIYGRFTTDGGFYLLAGQNWSLLTLQKKGMDPRDENVPLTIDAQYVPGFTWTRNAQVRVVSAIGDAFHIGLSAESPQALLPSGSQQPNAPPTAAIVSTPGGSLYSSTNNYTLDPAPDVILKMSLDPGFGHYEIEGLGRAFKSVIASTAENNTIYGGGVGAGVILPLVPRVLTFQASGLVGHGVGRYGSAQLPDVTLKPDGTLAALPGYEALVGLSFLPTPDFNLYLYGGREEVKETSYEAVVNGKTEGFGYGSPLYSNAGCEILNSNTAKPPLACTANTRSISQVTGGFWWKYYQGVLGNLQLGFQLSYTDRKIFPGVGGDPSTNIFIGMVSFRYYPYQK